MNILIFLFVRRISTSFCIPARYDKHVRNISFIYNLYWFNTVRNFFMIDLLRTPCIFRGFLLCIIKNSTERLLIFRPAAGMIGREVIPVDCSKVGNVILTLRKEKGMTQKMLAQALNISDRTVSKWERGIGCPDISLLHELSGVLGVRIEEILSGGIEPGKPQGGNMKKIKFYVCPICGNAVCGTGREEIVCCGRKLEPAQIQERDKAHEITVDEIEDELYLSLSHDMDKQHYISFIACVCYDRVLFIKLYPEQEAAVRVPRMARCDIYAYCSRHGLWKQGLQ